MKNKKVVLGCIGTALVGFSSSFFLFGGQLPPQDSPEVQQEQKMDSIAPDIRKGEKRKIDKSDFYMPQYKDVNGVCGMAVNDNGEHVAIVSDGACPTNEALITNYGYQYESLTDTFRPQSNGDSCGTAHLVTEGARIGTKDMAKLNAMARGNLESVDVSTKGMLCPTQAELSDDISNSVGVPVRFEYNNFNTNTKGYPVFNVSEAEYQQSIPSSKSDDISIASELSGTKIMAVNGQYIPKILLTPEAKQLCDNNFETCSFFSDTMRLENVRGESYQIKTADGNVLPKFMMTKGAWDVCGGVFSQCYYTPDETYPNQRGTVTNKITRKSYTSKELNLILDDDEEISDISVDESSENP